MMEEETKCEECEELLAECKCREEFKTHGI